MSLIVVDTETSDLPERGGHILELAWIKLSNTNGEWLPVANYEKYIQFTGSIDPQAQAVNHIESYQLTHVYGAVPRQEAIDHLRDNIVAGDYLVAHNSAFDSYFLKDVQAPWLCTYRLAKKIWPDAPSHSNQVLRYHFGLTPDLSVSKQIKARSPHQAFYDVATTVELLKLMLKQYTPEELYQMTSTPARLKTVPFGKHKGMDFNDVPKDYLVWLAGRPDLDTDLKFTIDSILRA
jgi:exodeoxyribonuclease X